MSRAGKFLCFFDTRGRVWGWGEVVPLCCKVCNREATKFMYRVRRLML